MSCGLRSDMTIITNDFYNTGSLNVTSVDASGNPSSVQRTLRIIVPWVNGSTCAASGAGGSSSTQGARHQPHHHHVPVYAGDDDPDQWHHFGRPTVRVHDQLQRHDQHQLQACWRATSSDASNINYSVDIVYKRDIR